MGAHAFNAEGSSGLPFLTRSNIGKILNNQTPLIVETTAFHLKQDPISGDVSPALGRLSGGMGVMVRPVDLQNATFGQPDVIGTLDTTRPSRGGGQALMEQAPGAVVGDVRRLTPRECERLQGLPDDWTLVPYKGAPAKDSYRYKAIGNSMAVPVMRLLGARIEILERLGFCRSSVE